MGKQIYYSCKLFSNWDLNPQSLASSDSAESWRKASAYLFRGKQLNFEAGSGYWKHDTTYANLCQCLQTRAHLTIAFFGKSWKIAKIISSESDIQ